MESWKNMVPFINKQSIFDPDYNKKREKIKEPTDAQIAKAEKEEARRDRKQAMKDREARIYIGR